MDHLLSDSNATADAKGQTQIEESDSASAFFLTIGADHLANEKIKNQILAVSCTAIHCTHTTKHDAGSPSLRWDHRLRGKGSWPMRMTLKPMSSIPFRFPNQSLQVAHGALWHCSMKMERYLLHLFGDVWKVSGINHELDSVVWKRYCRTIHPLDCSL